MSKRTGEWLTAPKRWRRLRAAAVAAPLAFAALAVGVAPEAHAATQPNFNLGATKSFTYTNGGTGEVVKCNLRWGLLRFNEYGSAETVIKYGSDDLCYEAVHITAILHYKTPGGELIQSFASAYEGNRAGASVTPVGTVVLGEFSVQYEQCEPDYGPCEFRLAVAAPK